MVDLNDLRVFEKVASLRSFSSAARALGVPKSSVSRCVSRLEAALGLPLVQRTTHDVQLTEAGSALKERCRDLLSGIDEAIDHVSSMGTRPKGLLKISASIGFGNMLISEVLPEFLETFPEVDVSLDLTSRTVDLIAEGIDLTVRMGQMSDSRLIAVRLGVMHRYLCAAPSYLQRRGSPQTLEDLREHHAVELPGTDGRPRTWAFKSKGGKVQEFELKPRLSVNDVALVHRHVVNGVGLGCLPGHLCAPDIKAQRLVRLFPEWSLPPVQVSVVFPSHRHLSPTVKAFARHLKKASVPGKSWLRDPLARARS